MGQKKRKIDEVYLCTISFHLMLKAHQASPAPESGKTKKIKEKEPRVRFGKNQSKGVRN